MLRIGWCKKVSNQENVVWSAAKRKNGQKGNICWKWDERVVMGKSALKSEIGNERFPGGTFERAFNYLRVW